MKENELARELIEDAKRYCKLGMSEECLMIDKDEYAEYNFDILKQELEKLNFTLCNLEDASTKYKQFPLQNKLFIYKK